MAKKNKWVKFDESEIHEEKDLYKSENFSIPQIQRKSKNIRTEKEKTFEPSEFVSPIRGRNVKDVKDSEFINGFGNVGDRYKNMKAAGPEGQKDVSDFEDVTFKSSKKDILDNNVNTKTNTKTNTTTSPKKDVIANNKNLEFNVESNFRIKSVKSPDIKTKQNFDNTEKPTPQKQVFKNDTKVEKTPIHEEEFTVKGAAETSKTESRSEEQKKVDREAEIHKKYNNTVNDDTMVFNTEYMVNQLNSNKNRKKMLDEAEEEIFIDELEEEYEYNTTIETKERVYDEEDEELGDFFGSGLTIETREADEKIIKKPFSFPNVVEKEVKTEESFNNVIEEEIEKNIPKKENIEENPNDNKTQFTHEEKNIDTAKEIVEEESVIESEKVIDKRQTNNSNYQLPPVSLLNKSEIDLDYIPEWVEEQSHMLDETFTQFGIDAKVERFRKGPTVTRYEVKLAAGINVKKIIGIKDNIKMNMAAKDIRIEAPIPGKPNVGIEVPNVESDLVAFGNIADTSDFRSTSNLSIGLGLSIDGTNIYTDISKMPHGLIAGATGSGKSVCINTLLVSLLMKNSPEELRLMLIDPKVVELIAYNDLPHLITPVINDPKVAAGGLSWAVDEMERRYKLFAQSRVRDIAGFNKKNEDSKMAYIVIVIDELADLMMVASNEVEDSIQRLTQKSRACGIHLIVATQRPTTDVVKGTIKSNIPSRIAFRVASFTDSVTILDSQGAESLLGMGDMLVSDGGVEKVRVQGAYISDSEIDAVTDFIRDQLDPSYVFEHEELLKTSSTDGFNQIDELVQEVAYYVVENKTASINRIQKEFSIGFNRAQKIVDSLEMINVVSENVGTKPREVLVDKTELELILDDL